MDGRGMLEFIVLGIVPGTNFVLTLSWLLLLGLIATGFAFAYLEGGKIRTIRRTNKATAKVSSPNQLA